MLLTNTLGSTQKRCVTFFAECWAIVSILNESLLMDLQCVRLVKNHKSILHLFFHTGHLKPTEENLDSSRKWLRTWHLWFQWGWSHRTRELQRTSQSIRTRHQCQNLGRLMSAPLCTLTFKNTHWDLGCCLSIFLLVFPRAVDPQ